MLSKKEYVEYLLSPPFTYTCTNLADHKPKLRHDVVGDFLRRERFTPAHLFQLVRPHLQDSEQWVLIADDSVQDKRYSNFIELVKNQYSGNEHGLVKGINCVNLVHSSGNDGDFFPIDYRIYHPERDGKTKNEHFQEMFFNLITPKRLKAKTILFDSWYGSVDKLKRIEKHGWTFFTTLKSNGKVSLSRQRGYAHLDELVWDEKSMITGLSVKLKEVPFRVNLFKIVAPDGGIQWVLTNDLTESVNVFLAQLRSGNALQIEDFHRGFKHLTGSQKCQCRKARSQPNHLACCYQGWISLKIKAKQVGKTIYQLGKDLFADYLTRELFNPRIQAI